MKNLPPFPESYFEKYSEKPVPIVPFNPETRKDAEIYIYKIRELLKDDTVEITHRGSTAFGIAGKGEIEIGVYPDEGLWQSVSEKLTEAYGAPENREQNYVRFNDKSRRPEVEIIMLRGYEAEVDKKLHSHLTSNPELLRKYERIKYEHSGSKRDYMRAKDAFFRSVISKIKDKGGLNARNYPHL